MTTPQEKSVYSPDKTYTIGYALSPKKQKVFITPSFLSLSSSQGLNLIPIDPSLPISSQSPQLHIILHKLYHDTWISNLREFAAENPSVPIIDRPEFIKRVQDRILMLNFVSELRIPSNGEDQNHYSCTFGVPQQITVQNATELGDPAMLSDLRFPLIAKPVAADGSSGSHKMALLFSHDGLLKQSPPLVLQEFINHGGAVFKVYVVGDYVKCVVRKSLPDLSNEMVKKFADVGSVSFSQISNMAVSQEGINAMHVEEVEMPPDGFVTDIARGLRSAMGLHLFNFDMIRDKRVQNHYFVIDINYFPGYEKLPGFEKILTDFLWTMVHQESEDDLHSVLGNEDEKINNLSSSHSGNKEAVEELG